MFLVTGMPRSRMTALKTSLSIASAEPITPAPTYGTLRRLRAAGRVLREHDPVEPGVLDVLVLHRDLEAGALEGRSRGILVLVRNVRDRRLLRSLRDAQRHGRPGRGRAGRLLRDHVVLRLIAVDVLPRDGEAGALELRARLVEREPDHVRHADRLRTA